MRQVAVNLVMMVRNSSLSLVDNLASGEGAAFGMSLIKVRNGILQ